MLDKQDWHDIQSIFTLTKISIIALINTEKYCLRPVFTIFHFDLHQIQWKVFTENQYKSVDSLSIHHANSRFLTIHQTNDVTVRDVVGYNTYGHGFFIEDGVEQNNTFDHNLGILVKPGIILPTDRHHEACIEIGGQETFYSDNNGKRTYEKLQTGSCEMLSGNFSN